VCRQLADFAIALRESRRINVEARWKRQTAAERSSYVRPIARRADEPSSLPSVPLRPVS
jgi:hypothetical protein